MCYVEVEVRMKNAQDEEPFNLIGTFIIAMIFIYFICLCHGC